MRSYVSHPKDVKPVEAKEYPFTLDETEFTATVRGDSDAILEWSEMAASAEDGDVDIESPAGMAFVARFFKLMMMPAEYKRLRGYMRSHNTHPNTLMEIMQDLQVEMQDLMEEETDRPTMPSSGSSAGQPVTEDRMSQIASIPGGDVIVFERPNIVGPTAEQRSAMTALPMGEIDPGEAETLGKWQPGVPLAQQVPAPTVAVRRQQPQRKDGRKSGQRQRRVG